MNEQTYTNCPAKNIINHLDLFLTPLQVYAWRDLRISNKTHLSRVRIGSAVHRRRVLESCWRRTKNVLKKNSAKVLVLTLLCWMFRRLTKLTHPGIHSFLRLEIPSYLSYSRLLSSNVKINLTQLEDSFQSTEYIQFYVRYG